MYSIILILMAGLVFLSLYNGSVWFESQKKTVEQISQMKMSHLQTYLKDYREYNKTHEVAGLDGPANPIVMNFKRVYPVKPLSPLMVLCTGQSDLYGFYNIFTGLEENTLLFENEIINPLNLLLGKLDWTFVLIYIIPLFIIAASYDLYARESELGTLRIILTQHISLKELLLAKLSYRFFVLTVSFVIFTLLGILFFQSDLLKAEPEWVLLALIVAMVYIGLWMAVCLFINAFLKEAILNGVVLTLLWMAILFMVPSAINTITTNKFPVPSRAINLLKSRQHAEYLDNRREQTLQSYLDIYPQFRPANIKDSTKIAFIDWYPGFLSWQHDMIKSKDRFEIQIDSVLTRQEDFVNTTAYIAPSVWVSQTLQFISHTDLASFQQYKSSLREFSRKWRLFVAGKIMLRQKIREQDFFYLPKVDWSEKDHENTQAATQLLVWLASTTLIMIAGLKILDIFSRPG